MTFFQIIIYNFSKLEFSKLKNTYRSLSRLGTANGRMLPKRMSARARFSMKMFTDVLSLFCLMNAARTSPLPMILAALTNTTTNKSVTINANGDTYVGGTVPLTFDSFISICMTRSGKSKAE